MKRKRLVYSRDAHKYVHEDTSRTCEVFAGYAEEDGEKFPLWGNMTYTLCGYWFRSYEGFEKYWRWNKEDRPVDCPECLKRMEEDP